MPEQDQPSLDLKTILKHLGLFIVTAITVSLAGATFVGFDPSIFPMSLPTLSDFYRGLLFAALLLLGLFISHTLMLEYAMINATDICELNR